MRILFFGDLVGDPGRETFQKLLPALRAQYRPDIVIVNGENSAPDGRGITPQIMEWYQSLGVHMVTSGNHMWAKKEIVDYIAHSQQLLRPANFPSECPGKGVGLITLASGKKLGVVNVLGRVGMRDLVDCPFRTTQTALSYLQTQTKTILVDFHAETTAEKYAFAAYFDGKVSAVVGTHTHVQTADERILPLGTAFITDVGMGGALHSSIGMKQQAIITQMLTQMPTRYTVETQGPFLLSAVAIDIDTLTGKSTSIERIRCITE